MTTDGSATWGEQCIGCGEDLTVEHPAGPDNPDLCVQCTSSGHVERAS